MLAYLAHFHLRGASGVAPSLDVGEEILVLPEDRNISVASEDRDIIAASEPRLVKVT